MTLAARMQQARLKQAAIYPGQGIWRVYAGANGAMNEILNPDNSTPYLRQMRIAEAMSISALSGVMEDVAFWLVRVVGPPLTLNQDWAISLDGGENAFSVQCVYRRVKTAATATTADCYEYVLKGNEGGASASVPVTGVTATLTLVGAAARVVGDPADVVINWTVTKGRSAIASITVAGQMIEVTGETQSGTVTIAATVNADTTYAITATDEGEITATDSVSVSRRSQYYWGRWDGVGQFNSVDLLALDGAGDGGGRAMYSGSLTKTYDMDGQGQFFVWVFPQGETVAFSTVFGPLTDNVLVYAGILENQFDWPEPVQVWRTNSPQAGKAIPITVTAS